MKKKIIEILTVTVLLIVMIINAIMLTHTWQLIHTDSFYREKKATYILPEGFSPIKTRVSWEESLRETSGWVVRYASRGCIYCKLDFEWERLVPLLERLNYRTILLLPNEADQFDEGQVFPETARQMAYVKMDWIKQFRFTGTPIVVIFDNKGRVLWHRSGMLNEVDYKSAEKVVKKNAKG